VITIFSAGGATLVDLAFLGAWPFRYETLDNECWFFLDFLGFSRPNLDLSMGYTDFSAKNFSWPFAPVVRGATPAERSRNMGKNTISHVRSLFQFLTFFNLLSQWARHYSQSEARPARVRTQSDCRLWANTEPTWFPSGRTGARAKAVIPLRARITLHRPTPYWYSYPFEDHRH
jgi:hypothetical protein